MAKPDEPAEHPMTAMDHPERPAPAPGLMLIDAHRYRRLQVRAELVRAGFEVLLDVGTMHGAEAALRSMTPAAVIVDPDIPGLAAADACRRIVSAAPDGAPVVILARRVNAASVREALAAGARGYVVATSGADPGLASIVHRVIAGETVVDPQARLALQHADSHEEAARPALTGRERDVLALVAEGLTNAEIGHRLYLSRAMRKLGVASRVEAAIVAGRDGLIAQPEGAGPAVAPSPERRADIDVDREPPGATAADDNDISIPTLKIRRT
jgi:DNA-binding NarL/FixJ family response regulator